MSASNWVEARTIILHVETGRQLPTRPSALPSEKGSNHARDIKRSPRRRRGDLFSMKRINDQTGLATIPQGSRFEQGRWLVRLDMPIDEVDIEHR